jgi:hypothetical protein
VIFLISTKFVLEPGLVVPFSTCEWRSKPQHERKNVSLLSALHLYSRRPSVQKLMCSHQSTQQYVCPLSSDAWFSCKQSNWQRLADTWLSTNSVSWCIALSSGSGNHQVVAQQ